MEVSVPYHHCVFAWIFREGKSKRALRIKSGARLQIAFRHSGSEMSILQNGIEIHRRTNRRERPRPAAPHCVRNASANGRCFLRALVVDLLQKIFEILDRDAIARASSGDSGEVGGS